MATLGLISGQHIWSKNARFGMSFGDVVGTPLAFVPCWTPPPVLLFGAWEVGDISGVEGQGAKGKSAFSTP